MSTTTQGRLGAAAALLCLAMAAYAAPAAVPCESPAAVKLAKRALLQRVIPAEYSGMDEAAFDRAVRLSAMRPVAFDAAIGLYRCAATLTVDGSAGEDADGMRRYLGNNVYRVHTGTARDDGLRCTGTGSTRACTGEMIYTTQRVGENLTVAAGGLSREDAWLVGIYASQHDPRLRATLSAPAVAPQPAPPAQPQHVFAPNPAPTPDAAASQESPLSKTFHACNDKADTAWNRESCANAELLLQRDLLSAEVKRAGARYPGGPAKLQWDQTAWLKTLDAACKDDAELTAWGGPTCKAEHMARRAQELRR